MGTEHRGADDLGRLEIVGDEDPGREPGAGRLGRHRVGQVAGRGAAHRVEAECRGRVEGDGDHPVLEGERRVRHGVVLEPDPRDAEPVGERGRLEQRSEAAVERELRLVRRAEATRGSARASGRAGRWSSRVGRGPSGRPAPADRGSARTRRWVPRRTPHRNWRRRAAGAGTRWGEAREREAREVRRFRRRETREFPFRPHRRMSGWPGRKKSRCLKRHAGREAF